MVETSQLTMINVVCFHGFVVLLYVQIRAFTFSIFGLRFYTACLDLAKNDLIPANNKATQCALTSFYVFSHYAIYTFIQQHACSLFEIDL